MGLNIGTKVIEFFGGTTSKSSWATIAKQAGGKVVGQVKDAPVAAKVAGGVGVAGAGYVIVGVPTRDSMAFNGQTLFARPKKGGSVFQIEVLGVDRRHVYGIVVDEDNARHAVMLKRRRYDLFEDVDCKTQCSNAWKIKQVTSFWERRKDAKRLRAEASKLDLAQIAA